MKKIFKYQIRPTEEQEIMMPVGAEVNHVGLDPDGIPCIWAIVDPDARRESVIIQVIGTGHHVPDEGIFLGTYVKGVFVWHVFIQP